MFYVIITFLITNSDYGIKQIFNRPVSSVAKRTLLVREVWDSITGPVKLAQGRQRLATVATFLRSCVAQALSRGDGPATRYTLGRNTASIMMIWFDIKYLIMNQKTSGPALCPT